METSMRIEKCSGHLQMQPNGIVTDAPLRIYTGILGQIGDIVMFTATVRRLKELFPHAEITFAVSERYRAAGELVAGLPYVDRLFVTRLYFEKLSASNYALWELGWPVDLRGEDEVAEQRRQDLVLETRPRHRRPRWWEHDHQVAECAHMVGVPGPIDLQTEICIPPGTTIPPAAAGKIVLHNDPAIDPRKAWPWESVAELVRRLGPGAVVLLGNAGPEIPGTLDLRGRTSLAQAAAIICAAQCYVGIDSGLMWIAGSLQVPAVGLYGTSYIPAYRAIHPRNPNALYVQAEGPLDCITPNDVLSALRQLEDGDPPRTRRGTK
jgi:Glycosyltransferase family 9 (heptosyltransferase)